MKDSRETQMDLVDQCLIIHVNQELDHHMAEGFRQEADFYILQGGIKHIIFDFQNTVFMDSSGVGLIMGRYKMIQDTGGKVGIVNAGKNIHKILFYSGLMKITKEYDNMETALADMR